jgi:hypothetical protein
LSSRLLLDASRLWSVFRPGLGFVAPWLVGDQQVSTAAGRFDQGHSSWQRLASPPRGTQVVSSAPSGEMPGRGLVSQELPTCQTNQTNTPARIGQADSGWATSASPRRLVPSGPRSVQEWAVFDHPQTDGWSVGASWTGGWFWEGRGWAADPDEIANVYTTAIHGDQHHHSLKCPTFGGLPLLAA